jgi:hypothetical protein
MTQLCFRSPASALGGDLITSDSDWLSAGRSVKLLLAFDSTVIPGLSLLEIHDQDFCSLVDMYQIKGHVTTDGQSVSQSWCEAPSGALDQILLLSDSCGFIDVGRPI